MMTYTVNSKPIGYIGNIAVYKTNRGYILYDEYLSRVKFVMGG